MANRGSINKLYAVSLLILFLMLLKNHSFGKYILSVTQVVPALPSTRAAGFNSKVCSAFCGRLDEVSILSQVLAASILSLYSLLLL